MLPDHAPDKDEGLDTLPEPRPVYYAEQALLGALLLEPHRLPDITGVEPDSFAQHAHGALFAAIRSLPTPDPGRHAKDASWLTAVLTTARKHTRGLTASYLHTLVQVCPWPKHAPAYARMVETDHARRTLRLLAHRLKQTATDTTLPQPVSAALAEADALARCADDLAARFRAHPGSLPRTPAPPPGGTLSGHDEEALDEERSLLATAIAHPAEAEQMRWLTAQDITHPLHAGLWQCLTALTRRGAPVDPVTVLWEAQHKGLLTAEITPRELLDLLETPPGGSPPYWGERILKRGVLATAQRVGARIAAFTDDPATTPYQLVVGSRRALADLTSLRTRWERANHPTPPTMPAYSRTSPPPRASPPSVTTPPSPRISR
ncbi:replicative DNA helicase [Streptomyces sp. NBC_01635]|uniref:DnaB-like helicase N-terminal domain-containing protein n=1 Tax=Streptomyces sp. NBC_01635 TaxID=2975904 RepID=UPI0038670C6B|nr:replicative DNA helicase [Streptomyces sp. NBC_01635]